MHPLPFHQLEKGVAAVARWRSALIRVAVLTTIVGSLVTPTASAQQSALEPAFSDEIIDTLGYPEIDVEVGPDGVTAPDSLTAGHYLVTLSAPEPWVAYLDFMQPPAGLNDEEATERALAAASADLAQPDWVYAGGNNTFEVGVPLKFIVLLTPGEYRIAASYYQIEGDQEEVMELLPLTVSEGSTPAVSDGPNATATLDMTDHLQYSVSPNTVPTGPQLWEITNSGEHHAHHAVFFHIPDGVTADDIVTDFASLMSGTPPAGPPLISQFTHVGYAALQSGGQTTWVEFDFAPGTYAVICFIIDPGTGQPHVMNGMATTFTVQ